MRWLDGIIDSMDMSLSKLQEIVKDRKPGMLQSMRSQRVGHDLVTEQLILCVVYHTNIIKHTVLIVLGLSLPPNSKHFGAGTMHA